MLGNSSVDHLKPHSLLVGAGIRQFLGSQESTKAGLKRLSYSPDSNSRMEASPNPAYTTCKYTLTSLLMIRSYPEAIPEPGEGQR